LALVAARYAHQGTAHRDAGTRRGGTNGGLRVVSSGILPPALQEPRQQQEMNSTNTALQQTAAQGGS